MGSVVISASLGPVHYPLLAVAQSIFHGPPNSASVDIKDVDIAVWSLRLPRILFAALTGASLSCAGLAFQSLMKNSLADPYVAGVSAGASVGSEAVLLHHGEMYLSGFAVPAAAFLGSLASLLLVFSTARRNGKFSVSTLILAGVITNAFLGSLSTLLIELGRPDDTLRVLVRMMGSFQDVTFIQSGIVGIALAAGYCTLWANSRAMNAYSFGEDTALRIGIDVERLKILLIAAGSVLTAAVVAFGGIVGFVGLAVPHIARKLAGSPNHAVVLPLSAIVGSALMVAADTIARCGLPDGRELPVGIVTAFLGAPFFYVILRKAKTIS